MPTEIAQEAIIVNRIIVRRGKLDCRVQVPDARFRYVTSKLAAALRTAFPLLSHHTCVNAVGPTFGCVMDSTSLPHMLEHLAIDLQIQTIKDNPESQDCFLMGTTEWVCEDEGTARIQVGFTDDLVALRAFNRAATILNSYVLR